MATHLFLIGINKYDPKYYGSDANLKQCVEDCTKIERSLRADVVFRLNDGDATAEAILDGFDYFASILEPGDTLWVHNSGHGTFSDTARGRATGRCAYDRVLWDWEIVKAVEAFELGVTVVTTSDCCFSESNSKFVDNSSIRRKLWRGDLPKSTKVKPTAKRNRILANYINISACKVTEYAFEISTGGVFTTALEKAIQGAAKPLLPKELHKLILENIEAGYQNPVLETNTKGKKARLTL